MKFSILSLTLFWGANVLAEIDPGAASASHKLEQAAMDIHGYLHHNYHSSYGSHELEEVVATLHDALHELEHGGLKESDILAVEEELKAAWNSFRQTLIPAGLLASGDAMLEEKYRLVKMSYKDLRFLLRKVKA